MGCGKGKFLLELAQRFPDRLALGSDIMLGRLRRVQRKVERAKLENVELLRASNLELVGFQLPDSSIDRIHLLCPDPWPKPKHRGKRFVTTDFMARIARVLKRDGVLHLSTDHSPYLESWQRMLSKLNLFAEDPEAILDIADIKTGFELLWEKEGKTVSHLGFRCKKTVAFNTARITRNVACNLLD